MLRRPIGRRDVTPSGAEEFAQIASSHPSFPAEKLQGCCAGAGGDGPVAPVSSRIFIVVSELRTAFGHDSEVVARYAETLVASGLPDQVGG